MKNQLWNRITILSAFILIATIKCDSLPIGGAGASGPTDEEMGQMGTQAFEDLKKKTPINYNPAVNGYVKCIANSILQVANDPTGVKAWEIVVFEDPTANAFALPGGKIGVHTGILPVATNQGMLAAVLGHEVGHVIKRHGKSRLSSAGYAEKAMGVISGVLKDNPYKDTLLGAMGVGAQYGVLMPFGRSQETEADEVGLDLMSKAGFDPTQAVLLWQNMSKASGGKKQSEFLSTHPSDANRIKDLQKHMNSAVTTRVQAQAQGRNPNCSM